MSEVVKDTYASEIWKFFVFMIMGSGANWVLATALALEIPYLENHQPEGLCVATYMNAANNLGIVAVATYLYVHRSIVRIPYYYSVPALLVMSTLGSFLSAGVYHITIDRISLLLYLCSAIGGCIGALSNIIFNPFMTQFKNQFISAARSGGSAYILLCAVVSIAQNPGASNPRFSVSVYMSIFGALLILPLFAYRYITQYGVGLRDASASTVEGLSYQAKNPMSDDRESDTKKSFDGIVPSEPDPNVAAINQAIEEGNTEFHKNVDGTLFACGKSTLDRMMACFTRTIVPESYHQKNPWVRETIPYMMTVAWVDFNTWGVMTAMAPFTFANAAKNGGSGSGNLAVAFQVGAVTLVLGDFSTTFFRLPKFYSILVYTTITLTLYSSALGSPAFKTESAATLLIIAFGLQRFLEAHLITSSYRAIATEFPLKYRQLASRYTGTADQVFTTLGAILSTLVVSLLFNCNADSDSDTNSR